MSTHFHGETFDAALDGPRLASQLERVKAVMLHNHDWLTLGELALMAGGSEAGCSSRLRDLRKRRFGSYIVERRRRGDGRRGLHEYRVSEAPPATQERLF